MRADVIYHYRDFPELFWDAEPDTVLDPRNPHVLSRVLQQGTIEHVRTLVDFDALRAMWDSLWLPERTRYVWQKVLGRLASERAA